MTRRRNKFLNFPAVGLSEFASMVPSPSRHNDLNHAAEFKRKLIEEADLLTSLGNPQGVPLRQLAESLPIASLTRLAAS